MNKKDEWTLPSIGMLVDRVDIDSSAGPHLPLHHYEPTFTETPLCSHQRSDHLIGDNPIT